MTLELSKDGYGDIMEQIQKIERLAWEGIFPDKAPDGKDQQPHKKFHDIASEARKLQRIVQENLLIVPDAAGPDGPHAA